MKPSPALNALVPLVLILTLITAGAGLLWQGQGSPVPFTTVHGLEVLLQGRGIYAFDTTLHAPVNQGNDAAALSAAVPLLVIAFGQYRRGQLRGAFLLSGALAFFIYYGAAKAFAIAYNPLFLVYTALFSASFFAFVYALTSVDLHGLPAHVTARMPHRGIAIFLFAVGLGVLTIWVGVLVDPMIRGQAPDFLESYTSLFTHALDIAIVAPVAVLAGASILRRRPLGYLLAAPMLILCTLVGVLVIAQTIAQALAGIVLPVGAFIGLVGTWIVMGAFGVALTLAFIRGLSNE